MSRPRPGGGWGRGWHYCWLSPRDCDCARGPGCVSARGETLCSRPAGPAGPWPWPCCTPGGRTPWSPGTSRQPAPSARWSWRSGPGRSGWRMRWGRGGTAPGEKCQTVSLSPNYSHHYLEQQIGAKKWEENDGRTAEEDQLEHGDDEPGQQQTSEQRRELLRWY